jgi:hypothetical protein
MKRSIVLCAALAILGFTSCTLMGTIYPVSENSKDYLFKPELIGKWADVRDSFNSYFLIDTVSGEAGHLYRITVIEKGDKVTDTTHMRAHLVRIGTWYYLDCWYKIDRELEEYLVARHFILRVSLDTPGKIEFWLPDPDRLIRLANQKKIQLHYLVLDEGPKGQDDNYLITDKPAVLRQGLAAIKNFPQVFGEKQIVYKVN